ncbi:MAG: lysophospholipase [Anaerolineales bacterium]|jgi:alpha-beta hydrolase superfamily lysophospholipase
MKHTEGSFTGKGGVDLYYQSWAPDGSVGDALCLVHGVGEHSGRYGNVVKHFVPRGYAVYGFDLRGHGRSPGQRGHINSWAEYREDTHAFMELVKMREPKARLFQWGHSMGSLISMDYVLHYPEGLRGVVISGSALEPVGVASPGLVAVAKVLSRVWPTFSLTSGLEVGAISRDPAVVKAYQEDPLVHGKTTPRWGTESLNTIAWIKAHLQEWRVPVIILHGGGDRIVSSHGSQFFFDALPIADKELHIYEGSYHEPHNDIQREKVFADVETWLKKHA